MTYTEEMTISEILFRLTSIRNELLQAVNDIEKISKNICYKTKQTKSQTINLGNGFSITANDCDTCKYGVSEDDYDLYDMCEPMVEGECKYEPKNEPQIERRK